MEIVDKDKYNRIANYFIKENFSKDKMSDPKNFELVEHVLYRFADFLDDLYGHSVPQIVNSPFEFEGKKYLVGLDITINEELLIKGKVREIKSMIQKKRKDLGMNPETALKLFEVEDNYFNAKALELYKEEIESKTNCKQIKLNKINGQNT